MLDKTGVVQCGLLHSEMRNVEAINLPLRVIWGFYIKSIRRLRIRANFHPTQSQHKNSLLVKCPDNSDKKCVRSPETLAMWIEARARRGRRRC